MTVALKAMQEAAARDLASADAATAKAKLLRPTQPEHDDPNIAAALAAASGKSAAPQSLSDRLAALRARRLRVGAPRGAAAVASSCNDMLAGLSKCDIFNTPPGFWANAVSPASIPSNSPTEANAPK